MKRISLFLAAAVALLAASCSSMYVAKSDPSELVDDLLLIEPVSVIELLTDEEMAVIDDDLSRENSEIVSEIILGRPGYFHVTDDAILTADTTQDLLAFYNTLISSSKKYKPLVPVPGSIKSIIEASGKRYALCVVSHGFSRTKRNYRREVVRDIGIAILTLGSTVRVTNKNIYDPTVFIIDSQTGNVVFFNHMEPRTFDPLDRNKVSIFLTQLFSRYKWTR